ncbi:MAG: GAF domain-containing protein [Proteobacteria bacterium]|nr:GAF domain-containing protein [Pseudomonadota bacterium]
MKNGPAMPHEPRETMEALSRKVHELEEELAAAHDEIQRTNSDLLQLTLELDDRVALRTAELRESEEELRRHRDHLQELVEERTGELKKLNVELKQHLLDLQASEERFRSLVLTIPDIVYRIDRDGRFTFINEAIERLGYEPYELVGRHFSEIVIPTDTEAISREKALEKLQGRSTGDKDSPKLFDERRTGERRTTGLEVRLVSKGQKTKPGLIESFTEDNIVVEVNSAGMYGIGGTGERQVFIGTVGVIRDISDRKRAEQRIIRQSATLNAVNRVFQEALTCKTDQALADMALALAVELTRSEFGVICEMNASGRFDSLSMSPSARSACGLHDRQGESSLRDVELHGLKALIARKGEALIINHPESHEHWNPPPEGHPPVSSFMGLPLRQAGRVFGMLCLANKKPGYARADRRAVEMLAVAFVEALMSKRADQALERRVADLSALNAISMVVNKPFNVDEIIERTLDEAVRFTGVEFAGILLLDEERRVLELKAHRGISPEFIAVMGRVPRGEGMAGRAARDGRTIVIGSPSDLPEAYRPWWEREGILSMASVPLIGSGGVIGVLNLGSGKPYFFDEDRLELLVSLGRQVAIGIEKARLFENQKSVELLMAAERTAKETLEAMGDGLVLLNMDGQVAFVNPALEGITGYRAADLVGRAMMDIVERTVSSLDQRKSRTILKRLSQGDVPGPFSVTVIRPDGSEVSIYVTISFLKDARGLPKTIVVVIKDVTEMQAAQEALRQAMEQQKKSQRQLIEAEKMVAMGTMTAGLAHELNNPMMGMLNFIQYCLKHTRPDDRRFPVLQDAERETRRCVEIVRNLLAFSRSAPGDEPRRRKDRIETIIDRVARLLSYRIEKEGVVLTRTVSPDLPAVDMDANGMQQVFLNLILNALDAMRECRIKKLDVSIGREGGFVEVRMRDTGSGVPPEIHSRIFDPFFTTKAPGQGTGLGLSVCRGIVEDHQGALACESRPGEGAEFTVRLPIDITDTRSGGK